MEALAISIPLRAAVADAVRMIDHRDHLIVRIRTEDGLEGVGFTLGYDGSKAMVSMVDTIFRPILEGADALRYRASLGRDVPAVDPGRPARGCAARHQRHRHRALGPARQGGARCPSCNCSACTPPACAAMPPAAISAKARRTTSWFARWPAMSELGFSAIKLKVGKFSAREDAARLGAIRKGLGDDVDILLDANGGWSDSNTAISALRRLEEYPPLLDRRAGARR